MSKIDFLKKVLKKSASNFFFRLKYKNKNLKLRAFVTIKVKKKFDQKNRSKIYKKKSKNRKVPWGVPYKKMRFLPIFEKFFCGFFTIIKSCVIINGVKS